MFFIADTCHAADHSAELEPEAGSIKHKRYITIESANNLDMRDFKIDGRAPYYALNGDLKSIDNELYHIKYLANTCSTSNIIIPTNIFAPTENAFFIDPALTESRSDSFFMAKFSPQLGVTYAKVFIKGESQ
jgi:hypothetical protein